MVSAVAEAAALIAAHTIAVPAAPGAALPAG